MKRRSPSPSFLRRHPATIAVCLLLAVGLVVFLMNRPTSSSSRHQVSEVVLLAPPAPPPPPPKMPPPPKKMVEQTPVDKPEPKPQAPNAPKSLPSGLPTNGKGGSMANGAGGDGVGGSMYGWYASSVNSTLHQALEDNPITRHSTMAVTVRIWADITGRIIRAKLVNSTGNPSLDDAIKNQVLLQTSLPSGPPPGMPMPINIRITARP